MSSEDLAVREAMMELRGLRMRWRIRAIARGG